MKRKPAKFAHSIHHTCEWAEKYTSASLLTKMFTQISAQKNSRGQKVNHNIEAKDNKNTTMKADAV